MEKVAPKQISPPSNSSNGSICVDIRTVMKYLLTFYPEPLSLLFSQIRTNKRCLARSIPKTQIKNAAGKIKQYIKK